MMTALQMEKAAHFADAAAQKTTSHNLMMTKIQHQEQQDKGKAAADSQEERISFTLFSKDKGILTKRMKLTEGQLVKDASECRMSRGRAETVTLAPAQFGAFLQGLKPNQAIAHGICGHSKAFIVSKAKETGAIPAYGWPSIARTKEHFRYPEGPGLLMLDHDKARANSAALDDKALQSYSPDRLAEIISSFFPEIIHAAHVSACSTSSCIYNTETGEELRGKGAGFHLYLFLKNAVDAPRFLAVLGKRLVLAGYGRVEISRAGSLLERTLADLLVGSPERLDFVAGAVCDKGLEQRRPEPEYHPGGLLDTAKLPDLNTEEEAVYQEIIRQLKEQAQPAQETVKAAYLEQEAEKLAKDGKISLEQARETVKTRQGHILADADLLLFGHLKEPVSVAHALDNGPEFNGKSCADPLEPEYNGGSRSTAKFYWNEGGKPIVRSYAHGGIQYAFSRFQAPGGVVGHAQDADNKEQPDSPLPLIKKNELSELFPFHVLGPLMEAACRDIQQAVQAPDALIAQCVLASANLAVQPLRDMLIDGRGFPLSLFLLTIAATGERKSAVDQVVLRPHRDAEYQADKDMDSLCALYEMELAAWEKEKSVLINDGKRTAEEKQFALEQLQRRKPKKPLDQKRLISDFTFEGMYKLFQAGVPSKGLFADEGGQVTGGHGMRQETILATAAGLSKFWDGAPVDRIRVMDGASSLRGRRLAVHLMMQDKVGLDFFSNPILRDQGLGSRMLAAWPTSTAGGRAYSAVNALETAGVQRLHERIEVLLSQQAQYREDSNKQELQPPAMTLSHEAKQAWVAFYNQVEAETSPKQTLEPVRGLANKAAEHAARIAGTVQLFENPAAVAVEEWAMQSGIQAMAWYLDEALRISGASNPAAHLLDAEKVLRWIHESGLKTVALPDMYQRGPVRSAGTARKAVETLKAHNHLLEPKIPKGEKKPPVTCQSGKKSREWWEVHPESNSSFLAD